eukprot:3639997-Ditylum_brightwellii.AAC.1
MGTSPVKGKLAGLATVPLAVSLEPAGVSETFLKVQPLDVATEGHCDTIVIDAMVTPSPEWKKTTEEQYEANRKNLCQSEMKKCCGFSIPNKESTLTAQC